MDWFKIWPSKLRAIIGSLPDHRTAGDMMLVVLAYLEHCGLPNDDAKIAFTTRLPLESVQSLRPYFSLMGRVETDRIHLDFADEIIIERQQFAEKKAIAASRRWQSSPASSAMQNKTDQSTAMHSIAPHPNGMHSNAVQPPHMHSNAIHTYIHTGGDKSPRVGSGPSDRSPSAKPARKKSSGGGTEDPRKSHPAIALCREIASAYPPKEVWDDLIALLGESPDRERLAACRKEWLSRGYNRVSWKWVTDWYADSTRGPALAAGAASHASVPSETETIIDPNGKSVQFLRGRDAHDTNRFRSITQRLILAGWSYDSPGRWTHPDRGTLLQGVGVSPVWRHVAPDGMESTIPLADVTGWVNQARVASVAVQDLA